MCALKYERTVEQSVEVKAGMIPCQYMGPSYVEVRYEGNRREGRCVLAKDNCGAFFKTSALEKAGCPKPEDFGLIFTNPNSCKFRNGGWREF